ncbi:hypothetical protein WMF45_15365 [Sorangium sp. So ce448]|uniref:hypothetical protein n=1 Tax=Sorangium sp. So ce448 TaxID=3133314 RepID=UPI003F5E917B
MRRILPSDTAGTGTPVAIKTPTSCLVGWRTAALQRRTRVDSLARMWLRVMAAMSMAGCASSGQTYAYVIESTDAGLVVEAKGIFFAT